MKMFRYIPGRILKLFNSSSELLHESYNTTLHDLSIRPIPVKGIKRITNNSIKRWRSIN